MANNYVVKSGNTTVTTGGSGVVIPTQVTSAGWSIAVVDSGATVAGQPMALVRVTVTERPANTKFFAVWLYKGGSAPSDPSAYWNEANNKISASGDTTIDMWLERESANVTYQAVVTACGDSFVTPDGSSVVKSVVVTAAGSIAQPTGIAVSVVETDQGGVPSGAYYLEFTPPADPEFWLVNWDRIWCDSSFVPVPGAVWEHFGSLTTSPWLQPTPWPLPSAPEYWQFRAKTVTKSYIQNDTSAPTVNVTVPASSGVGSVAPAEPVTSVSLSSRMSEDAIEVIVNYGWPSPAGTTEGVAVYYEPEDQSNLPAFTADGSVLADGSHGAGGHWQPIAVPRKTHVAGEPVSFTVGELYRNKTIRVYVNTYNTDGAELPLVRASEAGSTPNATIALTTRTIGPTGEEYSKNPTGVSAIAGAVSKQGAVYIQPITFSWSGPVDGDGAYIETVYKDANGAEQVNVAVGVGGTARAQFPVPNTVQAARCWFRGFVDQYPGVEDDLVNTRTPGITPYVDVAIGKTDGTVDLGEGITATVSAAMTVVNKVLGIGSGGITEDLIALFAVSQQRLANAQIIDAARIVDLAVQNAKLDSLAVNGPKIQDFSVDAAKIAGLAVTTAKIDNLAVAAGKIAALAVGTGNITNLAVGTLQVQDAAITTGKIQNLAIGNALIQDAAISSAKIQDLAVTSAKIASLDVGKLTAGSMTVASSATIAIAINSGSNTVQMSAATVRAANSFGDHGEIGVGTLSLDGTGGSLFVNASDVSFIALAANVGGVAKPATYAGFIRVMVNGFFKKIPYYAD
jgi:hypothetical protein